jgi:hypothetical protein
MLLAHLDQSREMVVSVKWSFRTIATRLSPFLFLFSLILLVNSQILQQDLMYPEQPMLYLVNQKIHSWSDLLAVYLHPKMLDSLFVPFFRPSGHFLVYQVISPLIGWNNTRGLLVVNFIFLTLMGLMLIKVYELLFPTFKTGGCIALAICLMHPLFIISRFTIMHFEFASIFFFLVALYSFMVFCQKNTVQNAGVSIARIQLQHFTWLLGALLSYLVAATFKEGTVMLMPALLIYLWIWLASIYPALSLLKALHNKQLVQLVLLLIAVSGFAVGYLALAWSADHPVFLQLSWQGLGNGLSKYLKILFSFPFMLPGAQERQNPEVWETNLFPWLDSAFMLLAMFMLPINAWQVYSGKHDSSGQNNKATLMFLYCCVGIFLVLPLAWNHVMPWHAALSLVFLSLLIGHAFESFFHNKLPNAHYRLAAGYGLALVLALSTLWVNKINFQALMKHPVLFEYALDRNAVKHPPVIAGQLDNDSVLVVEDRLVPHSEYQLGDSVYPFVLLGSVDPHRLVKDSAEYSYPYVYGGTMFRWAYANVNVKEQVYPFQIEHMAQIVDDEIIYNWLQHINNIYCLGFDNNGQWMDKTLSFKKNLLKEKRKRHIIVNHYRARLALALTGRALTNLKILSPDSMVCKQICDKLPACLGFNYYNQRQATACQFYQTISEQRVSCVHCTSFLKG